MLRRFNSIYRNHDARAVALLLLLWLLFFWRLFTPIAADQASLAKGDFSGQFVAFGAYQYERLSRGEIPLWNPYNNSGLPFIADTQAAVFYPPRWITIGLSKLAGGWSYNSLQLEMTFHVLLYTLLMYAFVRRLTLRDARSHLAALISAVIIGYGGFSTGYAPLQLAILEAAVWLPLTALGILEATRDAKLKLRFIALAGWALGLSWLAGHPQTSWFLTYFVVGYFSYRCYAGRSGWRAFLIGSVILGATSVGVFAVTLLPGIEYLMQTSREALGFAAKGNGFNFRDIAQFVFPGSISQWWPQYIGIPALFFVMVAGIHRPRESRFWLIVAIIGLLHSLGANSAFYNIGYNLVPGLRFFRGQERAAFMVANSLAIMAGLGVATAASLPNAYYRSRALRVWGWLTAVLVLIAIVRLFAWTENPASWGDFYAITSRGALFCVAAYFVLWRFLRAPQRSAAQFALVTLIAFELFSVNMDYHVVYDSVPHNQQLSMKPPPLVQQVLEDASGQPFRVDGFRGLQDNFGSLYGVMDMRGISPLFLKGPHSLIFREYYNNTLAWELFAVKYVFSPAEALPIPATRIGAGHDREGTVYLHQLDDPRPFAQLMVDVAVLDSDEWAFQLLLDPKFDERNAIILQRDPTLTLPDEPVAGSVAVESIAPEEIVIRIDTVENAILSISLPHYPGWEAHLNDRPIEIIRAYTGLSAVEIPAGQHTLSLTYAPLSYRIGSAISLITWLGLAVVGLFALRRR